MGRGRYRRYSIWLRSLADSRAIATLIWGGRVVSRSNGRLNNGDLLDNRGLMGGGLTEG